MQTLLSPNDGWRKLTDLRVAAAQGLRSVLNHGLLYSGRRTPVVDSGRVMGTYYVTTLGRRPRRSDSGALHREARERLCRVEALMSMYLTESDVGRFNAASEGWIDVSSETLGCVALGLDIGLKSGGLFDITAGPLVRLWGFGPGQGWRGIPEKTAITDARGRLGLDAIDFRQNPPSIHKKHSDLEIDLASVAKGFAVDLACARLEAMGVCDYCVEVGGEIRTRGRNPRGLPWRIAIETPSTEDRKTQRVVPLSGLAMATSGDYRIFREHEGVRFPHVIDPRTGWPVRHELASVTVIDSSCARADAWATALMVAGPKAGLELARQHGLCALFITRTEHGFDESQTEDFPAAVEQV